MGYSLYLYRIYRPQKSEIKNHEAFEVDSETKKALIDLGLKDMMVKIAGRRYIGIDRDVDCGGYHRRYMQQYYNDYWNPEVRNQSIRLGWDYILSKERLTEIMEKYVHPHLQKFFKERIIDRHTDGKTIAIRI